MCSLHNSGFPSFVPQTIIAWPRDSRPRRARLGRQRQVGKGNGARQTGARIHPNGACRNSQRSARGLFLPPERRQPPPLPEGALTVRSTSHNSVQADLGDARPCQTCLTNTTHPISEWCLLAMSPKNRATQCRPRGAEVNRPLCTIGRTAEIACPPRERFVFVAGTSRAAVRQGPASMGLLRNRLPVVLDTQQLIDADIALGGRLDEQTGITRVAGC